MSDGPQVPEDAIESAAKIQAGQTPDTRSANPEGFIADKLRPMITEQRLAENALDYSVMQLELSSRDERQIEAIKERLIRLPLTHGLYNSNAIEPIQKEGLKSHKRMGLQGGNTFPIDQSLGLDEYVYMHWGNIDTLFYGDHVVIDGSALLGDTIVTPYDITTVAGRAGKDLKPHQYSELDQKAKDALDELYFSKMVTGKDWLEIVARRVHQFALQKPQFPYPIDYGDNLGEVKRYGTVPAELITGHFEVPNNFFEKKQTLWKWNQDMLQYGISLDTPESNIEGREKILRNRPDDLKHFQQGGWGEVMDLT